MKTLAIFAAILISGIAEADSVVALHCEGTFYINGDLQRGNKYAKKFMQYKYPYDGSTNFEINLDKKHIIFGKLRIPFVRAGDTIGWEFVYAKDVFYLQYTLNSISAELVEKLWHRLKNPDAYDSYKYVQVRKERWGMVYKEAITYYHSCKKVDKLF